MTVIELIEKLQMLVDATQRDKPVQIDLNGNLYNIRWVGNWTDDFGELTRVIIQAEHRG